MLQATGTASAHGHAGRPPVAVDSFFFPGQFSGRATLSAALALAQAHGRPVPGLAEFAARMGIGLPSQVGVQDVMRAAELLDLDVQLEQLPLQALTDKALPVLLLSPDVADGANVLVLAHCDNRSVVTHDHACAVPLSNMGPLHTLVNQWAPSGTGWCLCVKPQQG